MRGAAHWQLPLVVSCGAIVACAETSTHGDAGLDEVVAADAGSHIDATSDAARGVDVLLRPDSWILDAWESDVPSLDAAPEPERCDGLDDDGDLAVDEAPTTCREAPQAAEAVCIGGACRCRDPATLAHAGAFEDCNLDWTDGCETPLDTAGNCGVCGAACDAVSACTDTVEGGLACRPIGILDFSIGRDDGEISCVVTEDHRVLCRGPNTEQAISATADETATLGWTTVRMPAAQGVRARLRTRADGREVLSVCVITTDGAVACRGDNGTGLLGYGDTMARAGNHVLMTPGPVTELFTWTEGLAMVPRVTAADGTSHELYRWTTAVTPHHWLAGVQRLSLAEMPIADMWRSRETFSWGPHTGLAGWPPTTAPWDEPTATGHTIHYPACTRGSCCGVDDGFAALGCWQTGRDGEVRSGSRTAPGRLVGVDAGSVQLAPTADGGVLACVRRGPEDDDPTTPPPRLFCDDTRDIVERGGSGVLLAERAEMLDARGRAPRARVDWQAMCVVERPDWWRCFGTHDGWGNPPIP